MARTPIEVDRVKLVAAIRKVEESGPLSNRSTLHEKALEIYNADLPPAQLTGAVVGLRIKEWNLTVKTPVGQRGRAAGVPMSDSQKAAMAAGRQNRVPGGRAAKFAKSARILEGHKLLKKQHPGLDKLVSAVCRGSMKAAVKLHCIECSGGSAREAKNCVCNSCPLFAFLPRNEVVEEFVDETAETTAEAA